MIERTCWLLDGDEGAETVSVILSLDLDNDAVCVEMVGVKESDFGFGRMDCCVAGE